MTCTCKISMRSIERLKAKPSLRSIHMRNKIVWISILAAMAFGVICEGISEQRVQSQGRAGLTPEVIARRNPAENESQSIAIVERKLMIPMRDGKRMATDVYRPEDTSKKSPAILG